MIKIEKDEVLGWEHAIRGMRNPMNSWDKSDSRFHEDGEWHDILWNSGPSYADENDAEIGPNDLSLMTRLADGGPVHAKYRRMIVVYADITAPLYWWKEFDTYKVGTVANSCSTMHKIHAKEFTLDDFSHEHLMMFEDYAMDIPDDGDVGIGGDFRTALEVVIMALNDARELYLKTKDKRYWWQMIQLLPSSYNQRRTVMLNYEVLAHIYKDRKNHKLDEWRDFCEWVEKLPLSSGLIITEPRHEVNISIHSNPCSKVEFDFDPADISEYVKAANDAFERAIEQAYDAYIKSLKNKGEQIDE